VIVAAEVPLTLATVREFNFTTVDDPEEFTTMSVATVVGSNTAVFAVIAVTFTMLGAVIYYPPKTIDIAMIFPAVGETPLVPGAPAAPATLAPISIQ
jgi:hypothetical protein